MNHGTQEGFGVIAWLLVAIIFMAGLFPLTPSLAQDTGSIDEISIRLQLMGSYVGAETLTQLEEALLETAELALIDQLGGDLDYIRRNQAAVVGILGDVIGEALERRGFALAELQMDVGQVTRLTVQLNLAEQRVQDFTVRFYLLGNTPVVDALVVAGEEAIASELYATVARTPYRDEQWLSGLVSDTVKQQLARMPAYAEFDHLVLVQPGETAKVAVTLTPTDGAAVVTDYKLNMRSLTLPYIGLAPVREEIVYYLQALLGAPLSFIEANLPQLRQALYQQLVNNSALKEHCPEAQLNLALQGCTLTADITVDSQRYLLNIRARLALWDYTDGDWEGRFTVRAGWQPEPGWALFGLASYYPGEGEAYPAAAFGLLVDYGLLALGYDFEAEAARAYGEYYLTPQVYLAADAILDGDYDTLSEISLHYRVREIYELQLVSNLEGEVYAALAASF
jgi:hypothetical protein